MRTFDYVILRKWSTAEGRLEVVISIFDVDSHEEVVGNHSVMADDIVDFTARIDGVVAVLTERFQTAQ